MLYQIYFFDLISRPVAPPTITLFLVFSGLKVQRETQLIYVKDANKMKGQLPEDICNFSH